MLLSSGFLLLLHARFMDKATDLPFGRSKRILRVGEPIFDVGDRNCCFRSGNKLIDIDGEAAGGGFRKPQGMSGLIQSKEKFFTVHGIHLNWSKEGVRRRMRSCIQNAWTDYNRDR